MQGREIPIFFLSTTILAKVHFMAVRHSVAAGAAGAAGAAAAAIPALVALVEIFTAADIGAVIVA